MPKLMHITHAVTRIAMRITEDVPLVVMPDLRQIDDYDCGVSSAQAILAYYGIDSHENDLLKALKVSKEDGADVAALVDMYQRYGLRVIARNGLTIDDLKRCIDKGFPVQLLIQAWAEDPLTVDWASEENGHYVVAVGYKDDIIIFEDPSLFQRAYLPAKDLMPRWHCRDSEGDFVQFGIVVIGVPKYDPDTAEFML